MIPDGPINQDRPINKDGVEGILQVPSTPNGGAIVLTHGAGADCLSALLRSVAQQLGQRGYYVLRCNLAFRQRRRTGPPHPSTAAEDRASLVKALDFVRNYAPQRLLLGGHSYGGRQASILAAEDPTIVNHLLLFSYPLHPPTKPTEFRTSHFAQLHVPCTFIHGTKDAFGQPAEMQRALELIPATNRLLLIEGAGHDLRQGRFDLFALGDTTL